METPSSMRMLSRSQKVKQEGSRSNANAQRSALIDITNDSPIVGIATTGNLLEKTPFSSSALKNKNTPGSGEELLRGQARTLLQKVEEEEGEFVNKLSLSSADRQILAPTPANTPHVSAAAASDEVVVVLMDSVEEKEEGVKIESQEDDLKQEEPLNPSECVLNRALLFDSPGKSESSDAVSTMSSSLTYQGSEISSYPERSPDDDNSSTWSLQVNTSIQQDDDDKDKEELEDFDDDDEGGEENLDWCYDDLCRGLREMSVKDEKIGLPEFMGKHSRFVYNSDDEIEREEVIREKVSPSVLLLKGLPVPEGKHLRFHEEEQDDA